MTDPVWPDSLQPPDARRLQDLLAHFWQGLARLADLLPQGEALLAAEAIAEARATVIEMMLGLNGIMRPAATQRLNCYLSASQRAALEKTLAAPNAAASTWIGQAVALVVIYRWYAPQLVSRYGLDYPAAAEQRAWANLRHALPEWPQAVTTE